MQPNEITEILNQPISQELLARDLTRLAYVARDGTPRNVPIAFTWNGSEIVMCTAKNAAKLPALRANPDLATGWEPLLSSTQSSSQITVEDPAFTTWAQQNWPNSIGVKLLAQYPSVNVSRTGVQSTGSSLRSSTSSYMSAGLSEGRTRSGTIRTRTVTKRVR